MAFVIRPSVRVLLLNPQDELLLLCVDDPHVQTLDGQSQGRFWCTVGGGIEEGEGLFEAAARETYEETGLKADTLTWGPVVWQGAFDALFLGTPTRMHQTFVVARTSQREISLDYLDVYEKQVIQDVRWFSLDRIQSWPEIIYPRNLAVYLSDILAGRYPVPPLEIDLSQS